MYINKHLAVNGISTVSMEFQGELVMQAFLIENQAVLELETNLYNEVKIVTNELKLIDGRRSKKTDGRIDILAQYGDGHLAVIELKKGTLTRKHLTQLKDYLSKVDTLKKNLVEKEMVDSAIASNPKWIGILVGEDIHKDLLYDIRNGLTILNDIPVSALIIKRFRGVEDGNIYTITETIFERKGKDYTKYNLDSGNQRFSQETWVCISSPVKRDRSTASRESMLSSNP